MTGAQGFLAGAFTVLFIVAAAAIWVILASDPPGTSSIPGIPVVPTPPDPDQ